jgi:hypothetical protein
LRRGVFAINRNDYDIYRQCDGRDAALRTRHLDVHVSWWPEPARQGGGQTTAALPGTSDVDFLGDLKRAVDLSGPSRGPVLYSSELRKGRGFISPRTT